jgi:hypothetical protein
MKQIYLITAILGVVANTYAQSALLWSKDYNTAQTNFYSDFPVIKKGGNTIEVAGLKNTDYGQRLLIVKYNLLGDTISTNTYGNDSVSDNQIVDYQIDSSGYVYILNREKLAFYKSKVVLQKYSLSGNLIWVKQIQSPADTSYSPHSLGLMNDTSIMVTLNKEYDYPGPNDDLVFTKYRCQLYAYNMDGNRLWQREFDPVTELDYFSYRIFIHNNEIFLFGGFGKLVKMNVFNNLIFNSNTNDLYGVSDVKVTPDNNLLISANLYRILKVDLNGSLIWIKQYPTNLPANISGDKINATTQDSVGNVYLNGIHYGKNHGTPGYTYADILTLKYSSSGNLIWENRYEYGGNSSDVGKTIGLKNGYVYVGGGSQNSGAGTDMDYLILKINASTGTYAGEYRYNRTAGNNEIVSSVKVFDNGNVALTGLADNNGQYGWTTQLLSDIVLSAPSYGGPDMLQVYPNPCAGGDVLTVIGDGVKSYSITSVLGNIIQQDLFVSGGLKTIPTDNIPKGIYVICFNTDKGLVKRKIVVK